MKMFPKTQDDTIDRLLRAQGGAAAKGLPPCREFDADLANAYVERSLKAHERASYESHLAACSPCRKAIVALTRLAQAEPVSAPAVAAVGQARGASLIRQWLGALTVPQWAMVAAAVIVLAVSLPLLLSRRTPPTGDIAAVKESPAAPPAGATAMAPASTPNEAPTANARESNVQARATSEKPATNEKTEAQAHPTAVADGVSGGAAALAQTTEPKPADSPAAKTDAPPQAGAAPAETARAQASADADQATKEKESAKDEKPKPNGERRAEAASAVAENTIAPPPPPPSRAAEPERRRERADAPAGGLAIVPYSSPTEAAAATPSVTHKISGHQFLLRGGVWTDKDYKPDKDKPVTIIRDSEVYHSLLARDAKIKPFLTYFPTDARVIFKFKGVVYKLIPQDADR